MPMAMRVVSIISRMNIGGPAKLLVDLINHNPDEEIEHILITGRCESDETDLLDTCKINSKVFYLNDVRRSIFLFRDIKSFFELCLLLRKLKPDIVHTHLSKAGFLGRLATKVASPKAILIHTFHGHLLSGYFNRNILRVVLGVEKFLSSFTNTLIAVSHDVKERYYSLGIGQNSNWVIINPGIRISQLIEHNKQKNSNLSQKVLQIIWIGRFAEIKNPKLAIEVYKLLLSNSEFKFELTMVGDGALLNSCKKYAQEENLEINFTGWLPDVTEKLFTADILIFTSENEGFGMVVVEAALSEALVVSTQSGGVLDFISNEKTGLLAEANAESFVEAIIGVCEREDKFKEIVLNARNLAIANFSADSYIERHLNLYRKVILRNSRA